MPGEFGRSPRVHVRTREEQPPAALVSLVSSRWSLRLFPGSGRVSQCLAGDLAYCLSVGVRPSCWDRRGDQRWVEKGHMAKLSERLRKGAQALVETVDNLQERIRERARAIWEREGQPEGRHEEHWREAENEIAAENAARAKRKPAEENRRGRRTIRNRWRTARWPAPRRSSRRPRRQRPPERSLISPNPVSAGARPRLQTPPPRSPGVLRRPGSDR